VTDSTRLTYEQVRILMAKAAGFTGEFKYTEETGWKAGDISCLSKSEKIRRYTTWSPRFGPLQDELATGYTAYKAKL
jgi:hypothetical protein